MEHSSNLGCVFALVMLLLGTFGTAHAQGEKFGGEIRADGSSTVFLITEAVASKFKKLHEGVNISIGISGTGGGLRKFQNHEIDICDASRKIMDTEADACRNSGVDFIELQVAWDGIAVVVNKKNHFIRQLTLDQLKKIWHPEANGFKNAKSWMDIDRRLPNRPLALWGLGKDSGTFDHFTERVNGTERLIRQDYNGNQDPNVLVTGVSRNEDAIGFFGVGYYHANRDKLNLVAIAEKAGADYIFPTDENVLSRKYPMSRPLYLYVAKKSLARAEVRAFVDFYLRHGDLAKEAGFVEMNTLQKFRERRKFEAAIKKFAASAGLRYSETRG